MRNGGTRSIWSEAPSEPSKSPTSPEISYEEDPNSLPLHVPELTNGIKGYEIDISNIWAGEDGYDIWG